MKTEMKAADVVAVISLLADAGIGCWLDGGWAVDAVVGRQTRPHQDVDLVMAMSDLPAAIEALQNVGFWVDEDLRPCTLTMCTTDGREVDIHPVTWDAEGGGVQAQPGGSSWTYPARGFSGVGRVDGRAVNCLSAEVQVLCHHGGYELDAQDLQDLELLAAVLAREPGTPSPS